MSRTFDEQTIYRAADEMARRAGWAGVATWREAYDRFDVQARSQHYVVAVLELLPAADPASLPGGGGNAELVDLVGRLRREVPVESSSTRWADFVISAST